MVQFNDLRFNPAGDGIIIDASVIDSAYFADVYIDSIIIDNQDTFIKNGPSKNPVFQYKCNNVNAVAVIPENSRVCSTEGSVMIGGDIKGIRLCLDIEDFTCKDNSLNSNLFFVYVTVKGTPSPNTPCGLDKSVTVGALYDKGMLYTIGMGYFKELEKCCHIPKNMIDHYLKIKGLELSLKTGHFTQASQYWKRFFMNKGTAKVSHCECNDERIG